MRVSSSWNYSLELHKKRRAIENVRNRKKLYPDARDSRRSRDTTGGAKAPSSCESSTRIMSYYYTCPSSWGNGTRKPAYLRTYTYRNAATHRAFHLSFLRDTSRSKALFIARYLSLFFVLWISIGIEQLFLNKIKSLDDGPRFMQRNALGQP